MTSLTQKLVQKSSFVSVLSFIFFFLVHTYAHGASAQFAPLVGLPGITSASTFPEYINAIYLLLIGLGGLIAVVRIGWIGVRYSMSESIIHKVHAKEEILGTFKGLAILVIPYIVLTAINPTLTNIDVLKLNPIQTTSSQTTSAPTSETTMTAEQSCIKSGGLWTEGKCYPKEI
jgi:hypothetical protein